MLLYCTHFSLCIPNLYGILCSFSAELPANTDRVVFYFFLYTHIHSPWTIYLPIKQSVCVCAGVCDCLCAWCGLTVQPCIQKDFIKCYYFVISIHFTITHSVVVRSFVRSFVRWLVHSFTLGARYISLPIVSIVIYCFWFDFLLLFHCLRNWSTSGRRCQNCGFALMIYIKRKSYR